MPMKRILIFIILITYDITSSAQKHPLGFALNETLELLGNGRSTEAYAYWNDTSNAYKTDSLYIGASAIAAQNFMWKGYFAETEKILNNAERSLNLLKSENDWWYQKWGQISTLKANLFNSMHDYASARENAANAKIAFEQISYRGMDYALALAVLSESALAEGDQVLARIFAGQALYFAMQVYTNTLDKDDYPYFSYIFRYNGIIELGLGYYKNAIKSFEALKRLNTQLNYDDLNIDLYLGMAYVNNGDYETALTVLTPYYTNCKLLQSKITSGIYLLYSKYKLGHTDIVQLAYEIAKLQIDNASRMFSFMSDQEKKKWWMSNENGIISLADAILLQSGLKDVNGIIADNEIFAKGLLLRSSNMLKTAALNSKAPTIVDNYFTLEGLREKLAESSDMNEQSSLEQTISSLEKELQHKLSISIDDIPSWKDISSTLSNKDAALEFVRFNSLEKDNEADYYVIIVKKGDKEPKIIHLFAESSLNRIIGNQGNKRIDRYITELYSTGTSQDKGEMLYNLIWAALEKDLKGCRTIYYSPAGILNSVSLQAISNGKQCLGQKYVMHLVSSISEIPRIKKASSNHCKQAVIFGGIQYDAKESELIQACRAYSRRNHEIWERGTITIRSGWKRLPGTEIEAKEIDSILANKGYTVELFSGIEANEESFKALSGKDINTIHIATHGFFLTDKKDIKKNVFLNPTMSETIGRVDPMLRSGLLFAGANRAWTGKRNIEGIDDGILTAKEITALDLSKVKLIVLSACQTGLGDVEANEGVYGLQRAFKLAGVETIIMSLWEVDDRATSLLMRTFYENYLNEKDKDVAFRNAINTVRNYKDENGDTPFASPYYWAAFIMMD